MRRTSVHLVAGVCAVVLTACAEDQILCAPVIPAAVAVVVRDSLTNALIADSAGGIVVGAGVAESLVRGPVLQFGDSALVGGSEEGLVFVQVERPGFRPWTATRVQTRLSGGQCPTFVTKVLSARLQR